jgi:hypothetical protein
MESDPWTLWTARISFFFYVLSLGLRLKGRQSPARAAWMAGFVVFVAHMIAAFQLVHHWSHADAYADTARKTVALTGVVFGHGPIRPLGAVAFGLLAILAVIRLRRLRENEHGTDASLPNS